MAGLVESLMWTSDTYVPPSFSFSKGEFLLQPLTVAYKLLLFFGH